MPTLTTRTLNPLPFQDMEPKRFEDLVRQLVYDFRAWRRLEATGRSGADEGFDARALEILAAPDPAGDDVDEGAVAAELVNDDRLWLIQCKREKSITPGKMKAHLGEIVLPAEPPLHGVIFAAACDFSKATRDAFLNWCRANGIAEAYIWGKGELEDMLYQPKNDNLLFAYFGVSLTVRRRSIATRVRSEITIKRKLMNTVGKSSAPILVRDPAATEYPKMREGRAGRWWVYDPEGISYAGLMLSVKWIHAYIDSNTGEWDAADKVYRTPSAHRWNPDRESTELEQLADIAWYRLDANRQGWLKTSRVIPFSNIVAVDDMGDDLFDGVHVYAPFTPKDGPFDDRRFVRIESNTARYANWKPDPEKRIVVFPSELRMV